MNKNVTRLCLFLIAGNVFCTAWVWADAWERPRLSAVYNDEVGDLAKEIFIRKASDPAEINYLRNRAFGREEKYTRLRVLADESRVAAEAFVYQSRALREHGGVIKKTGSWEPIMQEAN